MRARLRTIVKNTSTSLAPRRGMAGGGNAGGDDFYSRCIQSSPIITSAVTGAILWGSGDLVAQVLVEKSTVSTVKRDRLAGTVVDGATVGGALSYYWYTGLERFVNWFKLVPGSAKFVAAKCCLEIAIWHPFTLFLYWQIVGTFEGHSQAQIKKELKKDFLMTYIGDASLWTPVDLLNFKFIPVQYQVLFVNIGSLVEAVALSYVHGAGGEHIDAPDKISDPRSSVDARHWTFIENFFLKQSVDQLLQSGSDQFDAIDKQKTGYLTLEQLSNIQLLPAIDDNAVRMKIVQLLSVKFEIDKRDHVTKEEYLRLVKKLHEVKYRESFMADVIMTIYDKNNDGKIDSSELEAVLRLYVMMSIADDKDVKIIFDKFDSDKSNHLDGNEIIAMVKDLSKTCRN